MAGGLLSRVFQIQQGEGRIVGLTVSITFVAMASMSIGESGIDALFFDRVGAQALPVMYLLQSAASVVLMVALTATLGRMGARPVYLGTPIMLAAVVLVERAVLATDARWVFYVLWITATLATLSMAVAVWGMAGSVVDARQARRLFPIFGAGGILGAVVGGLTTQPIAAAIGTQNVLFIWVGGLAVVFLLSWVLLGRSSPARRRSRAQRWSIGDLGRALVQVRRSRLLMWMSAAAVLFSILFYVLYLPYAKAASAHFTDPARLAGFFGLFWAATTAAAFLVSIFLTNRLFSWFGIVAMVMVLPILYAASFGVLVVTSGFFVLVAIRFGLGTWLQGVASPGWEALVNVVPASQRDQTRAFLNGGPSQVGTAIAGVIAIVGQAALSVRQFALIGLGAAAITILVAVAIRRSYVGALVDALRAGRPDVFDPVVQGAPVRVTADADSVDALTTAARSQDVHERRLAFRLLAELPPDSRPALVAKGVDDEDPIVRLAAVRGFVPPTPEAVEALMPSIKDRDPAVAAAACARVMSAVDAPHAIARLRGLLGDADGSVRRAAMEQLDLGPRDQVAALAAEHLVDPDPGVRAIAIERLADAAPERVLEPAIAGLNDPDPRVAIAAGRALGTAGAGAVEHVLEALTDPRTQEAGAAAARTVAVDGSRETIRSYVSIQADRAKQSHQLAAAVPVSGDDATGLLRDAIVEFGRRLARAGLWAASMLTDRREEMATAIEHLQGQPSHVASALETLDAAADSRQVRPFLALWEPIEHLKDSEWLSRASDHEDDLVRRCASLVRVRKDGPAMADSVLTLSVTERILFLRRVTLFADLAPSDLERLAELSTEEAYGPGEVMDEQGEIGEELHIIIEGSVRVVQRVAGGERVLAQRSAGDVVGEMSLILQAPRIASLVANDDVRTIRFDHVAFEGILRERPGVALGILRVLAERLAEESAPHE